MRDSLLIRTQPLDVALYAVFRMAERHLHGDIDILDYGEYAPIWRLAMSRLQRSFQLRPRQKRLPLVGPWDLPEASARYRRAFVLGTGLRDGFDQALALARAVAEQPFMYDAGAETAVSAGEVSDIERIDTECRFLPESNWAGGSVSLDFRVIRIDLLGDLAYTVPLLALLKEFYPAARLSLLVSTRLEELARRLRVVDQVESVDITDYEQFHSDLAGCAQTAADWQILPIGGGWRRDLAAYINRVLPARHKIGRLDSEDCWSLRYAHASRRQEIVEVASLAMMVRHPAVFGYERETSNMVHSVDSVRPHLRPQALDELFRIDPPSEPLSRLTVSGGDVLLAPLGGSAERDWTAGGWAEAARHALKAMPGRLLLIGDRTPRQREFNARLTALVSSDRLLDLTGKTDLNDLLYLAGRCGGYIGANTAPMHLFALQGKTIVALNSPFENSELWRYPFGNQVLVAGRRLLIDWRQDDLAGRVELIYKRSLDPEAGSYFYRMDEVVEAIAAAFGKTR